jgi:hypothetical protein
MHSRLPDQVVRVSISRQKDGDFCCWCTKTKRNRLRHLHFFCGPGHKELGYRSGREADEQNLRRREDGCVAVEVAVGGALFMSLDLIVVLNETSGSTPRWRGSYLRIPAAGFVVTLFQKLAACIILGHFLAVPLLGENAFNIPRGTAVMIDGKLSPGEWSDAMQVVLTNSVTLHIKRHGQFLLLAIAFPRGKFGFTDLIVNTKLDLHTSAKLGERERSSSGTWPKWKWWNNDRWTANVARVEDFTGPKLLPENVREYQIDLGRFPDRLIHLEVISTIMNDNKQEAEWHSSRLTFYLQ